MSLWNVQIYDQGELISIDVIEETEVQSMHTSYHQGGHRYSRNQDTKHHGRHHPL